MATTIESILDEIAESGWLVNNLFQLADGSWQANLRTSTLATAFGRGPTPTSALDEAICMMMETKPIPHQPTTHTIEGPRPSLSTLLGIPRPTIRRRF